MSADEEKKTDKWLDDLYIRNSDGDILPILFNIYITLRFHDEWVGVLNANFSGEKITIKKEKEPPLLASYEGEWLNTDNYLTAIWMQKIGIIVSSKQVAEAVEAAAITISQVGTRRPGKIEDDFLF